MASQMAGSNYPPKKPGPFASVQYPQSMLPQKARNKFPTKKPGPFVSVQHPQTTSAQTAGSKFPTKKPGPIISTSYDYTELLQALKSIQSVIQCHSCHKTLNTARTCLNGHGICWVCKSRCNNTCPLCNSLVLDSKPVMLNDIIKLMPRSCNYSTKGCESFILANDNNHETFCRFRNTTCRMHDCNWKGMAKDLLLHLERFHGKEMIRTASQSSILMLFNTATDREGLAVIVAYNNIFWQHVRVKQNRLMQFYQYIPMEKPTKKFSVMISFHTPETFYSSSTPVHTDTFDPNQLFKDKETFCLPKKVAVAFNHFRGGGVHYNSKITEEDI